MGLGGNDVNLLRSTSKDNEGMTIKSAMYVTKHLVSIFLVWEHSSKSQLFVLETLWHVLEQFKSMSDIIKSESDRSAVYPVVQCCQQEEGRGETLAKIWSLTG